MKNEQMKNEHGCGWRVIERTDSVLLNNPFGTFEMVAHLVQSDSGALRTEVSVATPSLRDSCLVRLQSACLNGEAFGDQRCDCAWQLRQSLLQIAQSANGILIYSLEGEGRGAGFFRKVQVLALSMSEDVSSTEAHRRLGIPTDARSYEGAAVVLRSLGITTVRLLTNNPEKRTGLESEGTVVEAVVSLVPQDSHPWEDYLAWKGTELKHIIPEGRRTPGG